MLNGMKKDFSWATSAKQYVKVYQAVSKAQDESQIGCCLHLILMAVSLGG